MTDAAHTTPNMTQPVIPFTHNSSIVPMGDRVIRVKNGQVTEQRVNPAPLSVDQIEW